MSGGVLLVAWRLLVDCAAAFDAIGPWALVPVWAIVAFAYWAGQAASTALRGNSAVHSWLLTQPLLAWLLLGAAARRAHAAKALQASR
jgi:hypothetical protein